MWAISSNNDQSDCLDLYSGAQRTFIPLRVSDEFGAPSVFFVDVYLNLGLWLLLLKEKCTTVCVRVFACWWLTMCIKINVRANWRLVTNFDTFSLWHLCWNLEANENTFSTIRYVSIFCECDFRVENIFQFQLGYSAITSIGYGQIVPNVQRW